ncbi:MAG: AbgT family transporter [Bacteroidales bacterium]|nr:AbgT family transporter [Bacteroidales bacterium]MDD4385260.1 AbgT family transporter [Bacteroidales bacterium]MDY0198011.1 AbgT family transporter [Tenuifilaceae bacterium]
MLKKVPHTYVIVFAIIVIAAIMTWFIPSGKYIEVVKEVDGVKKSEMVFRYYQDLPSEVKDSFKPEPQTWQIFSALFKGFVKQSNIIVFILMIGGAFWIMNQSRAIDIGIFSFLKYTKKLERNRLMRFAGVDNIIIVLVMLMFSLFGAIFGMSEETIAFAIIIVPLAISMGYDSIIGVCMVYVGAHLGFAGAILNPFTIGIAQGLADIPLFSGIEYRIFSWIIINVVGIAFVLIYAKRIRNKPQLSPVYNEDEYWRKREQNESEEIKYYTPRIAWGIYAFILIALTIFSFLYPQTTLNIGNSSISLVLIPVFTLFFAILGFLALRKSVHFFILLLLGYTILFLIVGVMGYGWYVMEIATLFLALGIASGISISKGADDIAKLFLEGVKDILSAAIIVGLAGGIIVILDDGGVIDSILYGLSKAMGNFGNIASVGVMYLIQTTINIVIPSGSAKAAITMPIMAPFSDLIGISRQATVMAFQFGDGFTNMITPTSGVLIAVLGVARIPYHKWVKWVWPLILTIVILGFLLLIPTVTIKLNGF